MAENDQAILEKIEAARRKGAGPSFVVAPSAEVKTERDAAIMQRIQSARSNAVSLVGAPGMPTGLMPGTQLEPIGFVARHERIGPQGIPVPLDTHTGADLFTRLRVGFAPDPQTAVKILQDTFQDAEVEVVDGDQMILRGLKDPNGKAIYDMVVDERRMSMKDVADLGSLVPEVAVALIAARRGGRLAPKQLGKFGRMLAEAGSAAVGAQAMGSASDVTTRASAGEPTDLVEVFQRRGKLAIAETVFGAGMGSLMMGSAAGIRALTGPTTEASKLGREGVREIFEETGKEIPLSFGIRTGRPNLISAEVITGKTPTGRGVLGREQQATDKAMMEVQQYLLGDNPLPTSESIGLNIINRLRATAQSADDLVKAQSIGIFNNSSRALNDGLLAVGGTTAQVGKEVGGEAIQKSIKASRESHRAISAELYSGLEDIPVQLKGTQAALEEIQASLPKRTVEETTTSSIFAPGAGLTGKPITQTSTTRRPVGELTPEGLGKFLTGVSKLDPETPLGELKSLRTTINAAIENNTVFPGVTSHQLGKLRTAITQDIDQAADALGVPEVAAQLRFANQFYKEIQRFQVAGVEEILADPTMRKVGPFTIVNQGIRNPDQYFRLKKILTEEIPFPNGKVAIPAQPETWRLFKASMLSEMKARAGFSGTGELMDPKKFTALLDDLEPAILNDLLGIDKRRVRHALQSLEGIPGVAGIKGVEGKVNADNFVNLISSDNPSFSDFQKLVTLQKERDKAFGNEIVQKYLKGDLSADAINPGELVDRYLDLFPNRQRLQEFMAKLAADDPEIHKKLRAKTIEKVFRDAARTPSPEDIARRINEDPTVMVDPKRMLKTIMDEETSARLKDVIGPDSFRLLESYLKVSTAVSQRTGPEVSRTVGGLVSGSLLSSIFTLDLAKLPAHIKYGVLGQLLSSSSLRGVIKAGERMDSTSAIRGMIVSGPFISGIMEEFGVEAGSLVMDMLARTVGMIPTEETAQPAPP